MYADELTPSMEKQFLKLIEEGVFKNHTIKNITLHLRL